MFLPGEEAKKLPKGKMKNESEREREVQNVFQ